MLVAGALASTFYANLAATKVAAAEIAGYFRAGPSATGLGGSMSLALLGVGHLVGIVVGVAMLVGLVLTWGVGVPYFTAIDPTVTGSAAEIATTVWRTKVRLMGAGAIGVAALWTLGKLIAPIWVGLGKAMAAQARMRAGDQTLERTEQDIPIGVMAGVSLVCLAPIGFLIDRFLAGTALAIHTPTLIAIAIGYVVIAGFFVSAVCGYMAGLIGSSNSPVSGVAILAVLGAAVVLSAMAKAGGWPDAGAALVAFALFVTSVIIAVAVAANDNLQDLKTGQLVDATPWKQQAALVVGVVAGAVVIPLVLDLLNHAYGFAGAPNLNAVAAEPLAAPQAGLISTLAKGVVQGDLAWNLLGLGAVVGAVLVAIDETLRRATRNLALPPLAVGLAIYLPSAVTTPVVVGAVVGWLYDRWAEKGRRAEAAKRMGVLLASGLIVGESLFSVALAGLIVATSKGEPLGLVSDFEKPAMAIGALVVAAMMTALYRWTRAKAEAEGGAAVLSDPPESAPR